jgi:hypothetical protein
VSATFAERVDATMSIVRHGVLAPREWGNIPTWLASLSGRKQLTALDLEEPWLPISLVQALDSEIQATDRIFEFGGGGSTIWFGQRCAQVVTVEHDRSWFPILQERITDRQLASICQLSFVAENDPGSDDAFRSERSTGSFQDYVKYIDRYPDDYFDLVVVDGRARLKSLEHAGNKVRPGGSLILDDSERRDYQSFPGFLSTWPRRDFQGLRRLSPYAPRTSVWTRPSVAPERDHT